VGLSRLSAVSYQLSAISHQLSAISDRLSDIDFERMATLCVQD
jgi:hypothetical protein